MQRPGRVTAIYDIFCHHRGNTKYLLILKPSVPSRLKTAIILCMNFSTCYCFFAFTSPLPGRLKRPLDNPQARFAKYFAAMLYTGYSIPGELPREVVLESIYEHWHRHTQELLWFYDLIYGIKREDNMPSASFAAQPTPVQRHCVAARNEASSNTNKDDSDSDALYIDESADPANEEVADGPRGAGSKDGTKVFVGQQGAKPRTEANVCSGIRAPMPSSSAGPSSDGKGKQKRQNQRTSKSNADTSASGFTKERLREIDQKVDLMFENYLEFMIDYGAKNAFRMITLFEMTTREPPNMVIKPQHKKKKCTFKEKDHLFEDD